MYSKFFGFIDLPFLNKPDSKFFFMSPTHQRILHFLMYSILEKKELVTIVGEAGTGKTALFNYLQTMQQEVDDTIKMAFIREPKIDLKSVIGEALEQVIISEIVPFPKDMDSLQNTFSSQNRQKISIVLIMDDAQNLTEHQWDQLNLILNRKKDNSKLLHFVLIGRPKLEDIVHQSLAQQLNQQKYATYQITALRESESFQYIEYRLRRAGRNWKDIFSYQALHEIYRQSQGIPLFINDICDKALLVGFCHQRQFIDQKIIKELYSIFEKSENNFIQLPFRKKNVPPTLSRQQEKEQNNHLIAMNRNYRIVGSREEVFPPRDESLLMSSKLKEKTMKRTGQKGEHFSATKNVSTLRDSSALKMNHFELLDTHPLIPKEGGMKTYLKLLGKDSRKNDKTISLPSKIKDEYQKIKKNLFLTNSSDEIQTLMFASSNRGEGTSTVITNFAITLASTEEINVLLIDANFRAPQLHNFFSLPKEAGLAEIIQKKESWEEVVHSCKIPNLSLITAGETVSNPLLLFESSTLKNRIKEFRQHFDYILFDICAINTYPDPILLGSQLDGLVLVVQADKTRKELLQRAKKSLDGIVNILGVILNRKNYYIPDLIYQKL